MTAETKPHVLLPLSRGAVLFLGICGALFLLCVALRINGSSSSFWYFKLGELNEAKGLIAGSPNPTRSDEWMVWTPAILSQLNHRPPMPVNNSSLGQGAVTLLMSIPVRHYSMFFRPQLWGFFFLDAERGFAWLWNAKIFGLLVSFFLLFLALMRGRLALAILGSLAVSYSSFTQWWFSSPAMLPEMLTSWALALLAGVIFFRAAAVWKKTVAAVIFIWSAINFVLCCYPPFQIPLLYLALFLFVAFIWQGRQSQFHGGFFWLAGSSLVALALLWPTFEQCRFALEIIARTSYPGSRHATGGTMSVGKFFSGLLNFFDTEQQHSDSFSNASEASNFFPMWVFALPFVVRKNWRRKHDCELEEGAPGLNAILVALAAFLVFFGYYSIIGFPEWFCRISLLGRCTEQRSLLGIGIAGLMLTLLALRRDNRPLLSGQSGIVGAAGVAVTLFIYFLYGRIENPLMLSNPRFFLLFTTATALAVVYLCARPVIFGIIFASALVLNNFLVNPISQGLPALIESSAARHIAAIHRSDPDAAWAGYESVTLPQIIIATGARVLNGVKVVPDLNFLGQLDPAGSNREIYNRYAHIVFRLPSVDEVNPRFELASVDAYRTMVAPTNPALRNAGLKYIVFPRRLSEAETAVLKLMDMPSPNQIFIYKVE